jgi:gliding motility-associated-like protein
MKRIITLLLLFCIATASRADHITGGEMTYTYGGMVAGLHKYDGVLKLYKRCNSGRLFADPNTVSVFDRVTGVRIMNITVPLSHEQHIGLPPDPCITNPPDVCYEVGYYIFSVNLPASVNGYILASEVNYRIMGINNLSTSVQVGATYTCEIPGTSSASNGPENHSAKFVGSDLVVVCASNQMVYDFTATDDDSDILRYSFCSAFNSQNSGTNGAPASPPPYPHLFYNAPGFSEISPLGDQVNIDPNTGRITGIAPPPGIYVVTVCVEEIRNGVVIATQRKDIQIHVADCSIASAQLQPAYYLCNSTTTISITNQSNSPLITEWRWTVYDPAGNLIYGTDTEALTFTFSSTGTYKVKLKVNPNGPCSDEDSTEVLVYPGMIPDFDVTGLCFTRPPTSFTDRSTTPAGTTINSWKWDFGEITTVTDVSTDQHPVYDYPTIGIKTVKLTIKNTNGCVDTVRKVITIVDKPAVNLGFRDTLICRSDAVQLQAFGTGAFNWSPNSNISNANTATPTVFPTNTTWYYVDLDVNGCTNRDSVRVRVVDRVSLQVMNDTTICSGDTIQLRIISDGLHYSWTPFSQVLGNAFIQDPFVITNTTTPYQVTARIGSCTNSATINVTTVPYPSVYAGEDVIVCYNTPTQLTGTTDGDAWRWTPSTSLSDPFLLNPVASPLQTISYTLTATDSRSGCPKAASDKVTVTVLPKLNVTAGGDTTVVVGQPLQLLATGADNYLWSPPEFLSSVNIPDPVGLFTTPSNGYQYKVIGSNAGGCSDSAFITVKVFDGKPIVFVPTAFTPNNDGRNDVLRPIPAGIFHIESFQVYNRWGQLVFSSKGGAGWDGRVAGQLQATNTFVWTVKAIDYIGKPFFAKGFVTLIR